VRLRDQSLSRHYQRIPFLAEIPVINESESESESESETESEPEPESEPESESERVQVTRLAWCCPRVDA
jgi:hypothetical protein